MNTHRNLSRAGQATVSLHGRAFNVTSSFQTGEKVFNLLTMVRDCAVCTATFDCCHLKNLIKASLKGANKEPLLSYLQQHKSDTLESRGKMAEGPQGTMHEATLSVRSFVLPGQAWMEIRGDEVNTEWGGIECSLRLFKQGHLIMCLLIRRAVLHSSVSCEQSDSGWWSSSL